MAGKLTRLPWACRTYANLVRQAKSKQKILDKMYEAGLTKPVQHRQTFTFSFPDCDKLPPPVLPFIDVSFAYSGKEEDMLYRVSYRITSSAGSKASSASSALCCESSAASAVGCKVLSTLVIFAEVSGLGLSWTGLIEQMEVA